MQREHAVRDVVRRRLVAGEEHQDARRDEFVFAELIVAVAQVRELRDRVVARRGAPIGDELAKEFRHLLRRGLGGVVLLRAGARTADEQGNLIGQTLHIGERVARNAEHRHDDEAGQRAGEVDHEIDLLAAVELREQPLRDAFRLRAH